MVIILFEIILIIIIKTRFFYYYFPKKIVFFKVHITIYIINIQINKNMSFNQKPLNNHPAGMENYDNRALNDFQQNKTNQKKVKIKIK